MKNTIVFLVALVAMGMTTSCTDAERAEFGAYGDKADITCYSGGKEVFKDESTGKVIAGEGLIYMSSKTGGYVRAYADCVVISK